MRIKTTLNILRRMAEVPPHLKTYIDSILECPEDDLPSLLHPFTKEWDRPRGDLCHWVNVLNRFDSILARIVEREEIKTDPVAAMIPENEARVVNSIFKFTAFLLDNCFNRSIYASEAHLMTFVLVQNTDLVIATLRVFVRLGQKSIEGRYREFMTSLENQTFQVLTTLVPEQISLQDYLTTSNAEAAEKDPSLGSLYLQFYLTENARYSDNDDIVLSTPAKTASAKPSTPGSTVKSSTNDSSAYTHNLASPIASPSVPGLNILQIDAEDIAKTSNDVIIQRMKGTLPKDQWFAAINKLRFASSMAETDPVKASELKLQVIQIQLLSTALAAYSLRSNDLDSHVLYRQVNIIKQIGDLISAESEIAVLVRTMGIETLDALFAHSESKRPDILSALSVNVSHGVLMTVIRSLIVDLKANQHIDHEFSRALFSLILHLFTMPTAGTMMVSAGLVSLLLEMSQLRTTRYYYLASSIEILGHVVTDVPTAYTAITELQGVQIVINVCKREIDRAILPENQGPLPEYCSVDYKVSYSYGQWIRAMFHFVNNVLNHTRSSDQILGLLESPLLALSAKTVMHPEVFGYRIVSLNLQVLSVMLENETGTYAVMAENKIIDCIVMQIPILFKLSPLYFSAIAKFLSAMAYNEQGLELIKSKHLLEMYFKELSNHVTDKDCIRSLGGVFNAFTSDHPYLRQTIVEAVIEILKVVPDKLSAMCDSLEWTTESEPSPEESQISEFSVSFLAIVNFLESFLNNPITRSNFVVLHGIDEIMKLQKFAVSYDFAFTKSFFVLGNILASLFELDIEEDYVHGCIIRSLESGIDEVLQNIKNLPNDFDAGNHQCRESIGPSLSYVSGVLYLFYRTVLVHQGSGFRVLLILKRILPFTNSAGETIIGKLGRIQRFLVLSELKALENVSSQVAEVTSPLDARSSLSSPVFRNIFESDAQKKIKSTLETEFGNQANEPQFRSLRAFRCLASSVIMLTTKCFDDFGGICIYERAIRDHEKLSLYTLECIAHVLVSHLHSFEESNQDFKYLVAVLACFQKIIFRVEDHDPPNRVSLGVFVIFKQLGGLQLLMKILKNAWFYEDQNNVVIGAQQIIIMLLAQLVTFNSLVGHHNTRAETSLSKCKTLGGPNLNLSQVFLETRSIVLSTLLKDYCADPLTTLLGRNQTIVSCFLELLSRMYNSTAGSTVAVKTPGQCMISYLNVAPLEREITVILKYTSLSREEAVKELETGENDVYTIVENNFNPISDENITSKEEIDRELAKLFDAVYSHYTESKAGADDAGIYLQSNFQSLKFNLRSSIRSHILDLVSNTDHSCIYYASQLILKSCVPSFGAGEIESQRKAQKDYHLKLLSDIFVKINEFFDSGNHDSLTNMVNLLGMLLHNTGENQGQFFESCFAEMANYCTTLITLLKSKNANVQKWYSYVLWILELLLTNYDVPPIEEPKQESDFMTLEFSDIPDLSELKRDLFDFLRTPKELSSAMDALQTTRLYVFYGKDYAKAQELLQMGCIKSVLQSVHKFAGDINYVKLQTAVAVLLRLTCEPPQYVKEVMINEVKSKFSQATTIVDAYSFFKSHNALIARSPEIFLEVIEELCALNDSRLRTPTICLKTFFELKKKKGKKKESEADKPSLDSTNLSESTKVISADVPLFELTQSPKNGTVSLLLSEMAMRKEDIFICAKKSEALKYTPPESSEEGEKKYDPKEHKSYMYYCCLLQYISELVSSYDSCKLEFVNYSLPYKAALNPSTPSKAAAQQISGSPMIGSNTAPASSPAKDILKQQKKSSALNFFISKLIPTGTIDSNPAANYAHQEWHSVSHLASNVISNLLASNVVSDTPELIQNRPALVFVRKFALDVILKNFKDTSTFEDLNWKYSTMARIADLCKKLLFARPQDSSTYDAPAIAKLMFEKNFQILFTQIIAESDLNFPNIKRLAKTCVHLVRRVLNLVVENADSLAIDNQGKDTFADDILAGFDTDSEVEERHPTPDLFRNSALAMFDVEGQISEYEDEIDGTVIDDIDESEMEEETENGFESDGSDLDSENNYDYDYFQDEMVVDDVDDDDDDEVDDEDNDDVEEDEDALDEAIIQISDSQGEDDDVQLIIEDENSDDDDSSAWESFDGDEQDDEADEDDHDPTLRRLEELSYRSTGGDGDPSERHHRHHFEFTVNGDGANLTNFLMHVADELPDSEEDDDGEDDDETGDESLDGEPVRWSSGGMASRYLLSFEDTLLSRGAHGRFSVRNEAAVIHPLAEPVANTLRLATDENSAEPNATATPADRLLRTVYSALERVYRENNGHEAAGVIRLGHGLTNFLEATPGESSAGGVIEGRGMKSSPISVIQSLRFKSTVARWYDAVFMFGVYTRKNVCGRILNSVINRLLPAALERLRLDNERKEQEEKERQERREKEKQKQEENEAAERKKREEEEQAAAEREDMDVDPTETSSADAAGDALTEGNSEAPNEAEGSNAAVTDDGPVWVTVGGRRVDISGTGLDPTVLEELPEEIQEEVLAQHMQTMDSGDQDNGDNALSASEIAPEFLDALPEQIREELLQVAYGQARANADGETTDHSATANRRNIFMDMNEGVFDSFVSRARNDFTARFSAHDDDGEFDRDTELGSDDAETDDENEGDGVNDDHSPRDRRRSSKDVERQKKVINTTASLHIMDWSGVASLMRLFYLPQGESQRTDLNELLLFLCANKQCRTEILHLILRILIEGSADRQQLLRGFVNTTRASRNHASSSSNSMSQSAGTPKPKERIAFLNSSNSPPVLLQSSSPALVTNQILDCLEFLIHYSAQVKYFFIAEHATPVLGGKGFKKGKEKDSSFSKESCYAINLLFKLLQRPVIRGESVILEMFTSMMQELTRLLPIIVMKDEEVEKEKKERRENEQKPKEETRTQGEREPNTDGSEGEGEEGSSSKKEATAKVSSALEKADTAREREKIKLPFIPDENLHLLAEIMTAKNCSTRAFQQCLAIILNLCYIKGVGDFFSNELLQQVNEVVPSIMIDLKELLEKVKMIKNETELQQLPLYKFSTPLSDQSKLLRILTAADFLFNPASQPTVKISDEAKVEAEDKLKKLYQSMNLGALWNSLGALLRLLSDRPELSHVATALLPLMESLMVICKNSKVKDVQLRGEMSAKYESQRQYEYTAESDFTEEPLESLFFTFTDEHRKVLNQMVRNNPKLMNGSFAILVKNPKAMDFDNKRRYFQKRIFPSDDEYLKTTIPLNVRRDRVFLESYRALYFQPAEHFKKSRLNIKFQGEEGVDGGGVTREWYQVLARQIFNPDYALFMPVASDKTTFHPNRTSWVNPEHLSFFKFVGRIIGKAIYDSKLLDCHFSRAVYKKILGKNVNLKDMETLDLDYYKSLLWMLENDITDIITETFSIEADDYGEQKIIDLKPGGRNIAVTEENKAEYVNLVVDYRLLKSIEEQMEHFLEGFHDIIPKDVVAIFDEQELELLISGLPDIDIDDWRLNTEYVSYTASSQQVKWFWRAVRSFDMEERAKLLQFATGTSKVPLNGFKELAGINGTSKFSIQRDYGSKDRLPASHTCFNMIDLPEYDSYEALRAALLMAITEGREGFGFA